MGAEMELSKTTQEVLILKSLRKNLWLDKPNGYWFCRLAEEFGELGASLAGDHEHPPESEIAQMASICLNWLEKMERDYDKATSGT